jgi:hypothetical protein
MGRYAPETNTTSTVPARSKEVSGVADDHT